MDHLFAEIWPRPGLSQIGAALRNNELSPDELREVAIYLTHHAGRPSGAKLSMLTDKLIGEDAMARARQQ